jgi:hypothetical protein
MNEKKLTRVPRVSPRELKALWTFSKNQHGSGIMGNDLFGLLWGDRPRPSFAAHIRCACFQLAMEKRYGIDLSTWPSPLRYPFFVIASLIPFKLDCASLKDHPSFTGRDEIDLRVAI